MRTFKRTVIKKDIISEERQIEKIKDRGNIKYRVVYITKYHVVLSMLFDIYEKEIEERETSSLLFNKIELAESYAKATYKCDINISPSNYRDIVQIFPNGYQAIEKYGQFTYNDHCLSVYDWDSESSFLTFKYNDDDTYGTATYIRIVEWLNGKLNCIDKVIEEANFNESPVQIVKAFNVATMEYIPVDQLNASSEELKQLKILLQEYYEKQKQYEDFVTKLYEQAKQLHKSYNN